MEVLENIKDWWNVYRHLKKEEPFYQGLCIILDRANYKITGDILYTVSKKLKIYHNPLYYNSKGLKLKHEIGYWWDRKDRESRLKALSILEQAIIND